MHNAWSPQMHKHLQFSRGESSRVHLSNHRCTRCNGTTKQLTSRTQTREIDLAIDERVQKLHLVILIYKLEPGYWLLETFQKASKRWERHLYEILYAHTGSSCFCRMFAMRLPVAMQSRCLPRYFFTHARLSLLLERVLFHALTGIERSNVTAWPANGRHSRPLWPRQTSTTFLENPSATLASLLFSLPLPATSCFLPCVPKTLHNYAKLYSEYKKYCRTSLLLSEAFLFSLDSIRFIFIVSDLF